MLMKVKCSDLSVPMVQERQQRLEFYVDYSKPDSGYVELLGSELKKNKKEIQNQIGYLSQKFSLYGDLSVDENIEFFADIHNVKGFYNQKRRTSCIHKINSIS